MPPPNTPDGDQPTVSILPGATNAPSSLVDAEENDPADYTVVREIDLRSLDYTSEVDENLICPVCRVALIDPITTMCDHVFCRDCFHKSYRHSPICPIDRCSLILPHDIGPTHKLILNQLDALEVRCPNLKDGCTKVLARSMVQNHVEKYCDLTLVACEGPECLLGVPRQRVLEGCLHANKACPDCGEQFMELYLEQHRRDRCEKRETKCEKCSTQILRYQADLHKEACTEEMSNCKWAIYGCNHSSKRKDLVDHAPLCDFKIMGPVVESLKSEIVLLRGDIQTLNEKDKAKDRRLRLLENERSHSPSPSSSRYPLFDPLSPPTHLARSTSPSLSHNHDELQEYTPYNSRDQYLLSLLESQESKVDHISANMTELEAKQTMMLFNETIPIKEQLAELRSAQSVIGMHVRWLMNFRLQETRPVKTAAAGSASTTGAGTGAGTVAGPSGEKTGMGIGMGMGAGGSMIGGGVGKLGGVPRRLSDTLRENITKL
jgi:TNF receptor-associated factor 5